MVQKPQDALRNAIVMGGLAGLGNMAFGQGGFTGSAIDAGLVKPYVSASTTNRDYEGTIVYQKILEYYNKQLKKVLEMQLIGKWFYDKYILE